MMIITQYDWFIYIEIAYLIGVCLIALRVIYDSNSTSKALAYLLLIFFVPILGVIFYFSFGVNYRKRKMFTKKLKADDAYGDHLNERLQAIHLSFKQGRNPLVQQNRTLIKMLSNSNMGENPLLTDNKVDILKNGETYFPTLLEDLRNAKEYIHIEYYIYEDDIIGSEIADVLIAKSKEGIPVRFIYDDFGCRSIRKTIVKELLDAGVEAYPFNKIIWIALANRMNYRNHRKIVVIDGVIGYTGGINVSARYDNRKKMGNDHFWRDTHMRIEGNGTFGLQHIFLCDWNFCSGQNLVINQMFFPEIPSKPDRKLPVQIISSGPDSDLPSILYSVLQSIHNAQSEILITTPYYIPDESLQQAIIMAAMSGKKVKILLPGITDSKLVKWASESYFEELLKVGVELYFYQKGFIHAKTFVTDSGVSSIGTCNLDHRSFDLNFEVNAMIYDHEFAQEMRTMFYDDCKHATKLEYHQWHKRSKWHRFKNSCIRLLSPLL